MTEVRKNVVDAQVTILLEVDGDMHLVAMTEDRLDAITSLVKQSAEYLVRTEKTQRELNNFLNYNKG